MGKLAALVTSALVLVGLQVAAPVAGADDKKTDKEDFTLLARITDFDKDDRGRDGPSRGDRFSWKADLEDEDGDDAGDAAGACVLTEVGDRDGRRRDFSARCRAIFDLDDGRLRVAGEVTDEDFRDGDVRLPVTGGTGEYRDAEGDATFERMNDDGHDRDGKHEFEVTFDLK
jgi:hypothetical protein